VHKRDIPSETIEDVINRIENEAGSTIDWQEFTEFFTRRGRPKSLSSKMMLN